jgi:hypothetical protein
MEKGATEATSGSAAEAATTTETAATSAAETGTTTKISSDSEATELSAAKETCRGDEVGHNH